MNQSNAAFPFTAIVGQEAMKLALCLNAVHPGIGGVLVSGARGTAKTTAVRALSGLLGAARVVELPLNASEDRVVGTLRVDELMKSGERVLEPGILAQADGNILYVDEVNLLEDHLVDLLLDAAATGVCRVEREGVSREYPARFVLVGTMNPEEGTLRPQLLDRFGLSVKVQGELSVPERLELLERHVDFERDPVRFCARFEESERELSERIAAAETLYAQVTYPERMARLAAGICDGVGIEGYRADIAIMRTARAVAAFDGRREVTREDVMLAARLALPHRMKRMPFEEAELSDALLQKVAEACDGDGHGESPFDGDDAPGAELEGAVPLASDGRAESGDYPEGAPVDAHDGLASKKPRG